MVIDYVDTASLYQLYHCNNSIRSTILTLTCIDTLYINDTTNDVDNDSLLELMRFGLSLMYPKDSNTNKLHYNRISIFINVFNTENLRIDELLQTVSKYFPPSLRNGNLSRLQELRIVIHGNVNICSFNIQSFFSRISQYISHGCLTALKVLILGIHYPYS